MFAATFSAPFHRPKSGPQRPGLPPLQRYRYCSASRQFLRRDVSRSERDLPIACSMIRSEPTLRGGALAQLRDASAQTRTVESRDRSKGESTAVWVKTVAATSTSWSARSKPRAARAVVSSYSELRLCGDLYPNHGKLE